MFRFFFYFKLTGVYPFMSNQMGGLAENFAAVIAREMTFAFMNAFVCFEVMRIFEIFPARFTPIFLVSCVHGFFTITSRRS
jgi:hypothetical protein